MGLITFPVVGGVKNGDGLSLGEGILRSGLKNSECNDDKAVMMRVVLCGCSVEEEDEVKEGEGGSHVEETRQETRKESETQTVAGCLLAACNETNRLTRNNKTRRRRRRKRRENQTQEEVLLKPSNQPK